jgi:hypothetical protein
VLLVAVALGVAALAGAFSKGDDGASEDEAAQAASEAQELTDYLIDVLGAYLYGETRRLVEGSDFSAGVENLRSSCSKALDENTLRQEPGFDPALHEEVISAIEQACLITGQMHADEPQSVVLAGRALAVLGNVVPEDRRGFITDLPTPDPNPPPITTQQLTDYLVDELLYRLFDSVSRMTGHRNLENCGSPCNFGFMDNAERTQSFCLKALDPVSVRQEAGYVAAVHEELVSALDRACGFVAQIEAEDDAGRQLAEAAFDLLHPFAPPEWEW